MLKLEKLENKGYQIPIVYFCSQGNCSHLQNHRKLCVGRDVKGHLVSAPLSWPGTLSTRLGSMPHPY